MRRTKPRSRTRATRDAARTTAPIDHKPGIVLSLASVGATPANDDPAYSSERRPSRASFLPHAAGSAASGTPRGALRARLLGCRWRWRPASRAPTASRGRGDLRHGSARGAHEYREHFMAGAPKVTARVAARCVDVRDVHVGGAQPGSAAPRARRPGRRLQPQRRVESPPARGRSSRRSSHAWVAGMRRGRTHDAQPSHCQQRAALVQQRPRLGSSRSANR
jgi:hypothetical protein